MEPGRFGQAAFSKGCPKNQSLELAVTQSHGHCENTLAICLLCTFNSPRASLVPLSAVLVVFGTRHQRWER